MSLVVKYRMIKMGWFKSQELVNNKPELIDQAVCNYRVVIWELADWRETYEL